MEFIKIQLPFVKITESFLFFINFWGLSVFVLSYAYIFYLALLYDTKFILIIKRKKDLWRCIRFIFIVISLSIYIFLLRLTRMHLTLNTTKLSEAFLNWIEIQPWFNLLLLVLFLIEMLLLWFLFLKWLIANFRRYCLSLYLYYYQSKEFKYRFCFPLITFYIDFHDYLTDRVYLFTKNPKILKLARKIWPGSFNQLKNKIFIVLLPYLVVFDYFTQDGLITLVFQIMPWYYICFILKVSLELFFYCYSPENNEISDELYRKHSYYVKIPLK